MGFWKNVDEYIKFKNISRKTLAAGIGMKPQTIDRAIQRDSEPKFTEGLKVCRYLKVEYDEFLDEPLTVQNDISPTSTTDNNQGIKLYRKYHDLIENCENLPQYQQNSVKQLAQSLANSKPSYEPTDEFK